MSFLPFLLRKRVDCRTVPCHKDRDLTHAMVRHLMSRSQISDPSETNPPMYLNRC